MFPPCGDLDCDSAWLNGGFLVASMHAGGAKTGDIPNFVAAFQPEHHKAIYLYYGMEHGLRKKQTPLIPQHKPDHKL